MPYYYYENTRTFTYQTNCMIAPIGSSVVFGILFSGLDAFQGAPLKAVFTPKHMGKLLYVL